MQNARHEILIWLPSPMGDAILCTPALRAIRRHFSSSQITFFAKSVVCQILSPNNSNDIWLQQKNDNPFAIAKTLKSHKFTHAVLFKNSFNSALAAFLARIPIRIGYARQGRSLFLTDKLYPPKLPNGKFKPISMIDYYLAIASRLGTKTDDRSLELSVEPKDTENLRLKLPQIQKSQGPLVVLVPGGAFGPSKCWPSERFAATADWLISNYNATIIVSVSQAPLEKKIADEICSLSKHKLINLAEKPLSLGELKSLFSIADLVISNDTGPRHIAIALQRKVITLFGPNDPAWTETDYENEIQLIGAAPCVPCQKPKCEKPELLCMQAIKVNMVCDAVKKLLEKNQKPPKKTKQKFVEISKSFSIDSNFKEAFSELGLLSIDSVFSFNAGSNLTKENLAEHRTRIQFDTTSPPTTMFLKRYDNPPISEQLRNWLSHRRRISSSLAEIEPVQKLNTAGLNTPKIIAHGQQWGNIFEKRSFVIIEKIPNAESLERKLPSFFSASPTAENLKLRRNFILQLAEFIKKFHQTNYRHRDLYFSHIFYDNNSQFYLIDLARAFKPTLFAERFQIKDIAQLYYSAPGKYFSKTDRLRFYLCYMNKNKLNQKDKTFIIKVIKKVKRMARHDKKHGRIAPFTI